MAKKHLRRSLCCARVKPYLMDHRRFFVLLLLEFLGQVVVLALYRRSSNYIVIAIHVECRRTRCDVKNLRLPWNSFLIIFSALHVKLPIVQQALSKTARHDRARRRNISQLKAWISMAHILWSALDVSAVSRSADDRWKFAGCASWCRKLSIEVEPEKHKFVSERDKFILEAFNGGACSSVVSEFF